MQPDYDELTSKESRLMVGALVSLGTTVSALFYSML